MLANGFCYFNLGDHCFIEEKTYWMHKQNDKFMRQPDESICQINVDCRKRKKHESFSILVISALFLLESTVYYLKSKKLQRNVLTAKFLGHG